MELGISGKTALVTGASIGIGRGIAVKLAGEGVRLAVMARRRNLLDELAAEIVAKGGAKPVIIECNALDEDAADRDITTIATVRAGERTRPRLVARQAGVISGVPLALATFRALDPDVSSRVDADDGTTVAAGQDVLFISGHGRAS